MESEFTFERTSETRQIAELALGRLLDSLDRDLELIVLGGLVPEVLTSGLDESIPKHMGTADVDLLVNVVVGADDADLVALESALEQADFGPDPKQRDGWRWQTAIHGLTVKVDLLCDLETVQSEMTVRPDGCERLGVYNLRGTGYVARDFTWQEIAIASDAEPTRHRVRFAGLAGYLLAKAHAARHRGLDKDYYDLVHVLLYNKEGGPAEAAALLSSDEWADAVAASRSALAEIGARFSSPADRAPRAYAAGALQVDPGGDDTALRRDAIAAVTRFLEALG